MSKHFFRLALAICLVLGMVACTSSRKAGGCKVNAGYVGY